MKRFIVLTTTIRMMGGAQMYAANKLKYYEQLGWIPDIYFFNKGNVRIDFLKRFTDNYIPELSKPFKSCNRKEKERILKKITQRFNSDDELLFECHTPELAYWGEYLAKKTNGKNTVFLIEESLPRFSEKELDFYDFKYKRGELMNNYTDSLKLIFQKRYNSLRYLESKSPLHPYCNNVINYEFTALPKATSLADFSILSIGRLDKPYIRNALNQILKFIQEYNYLKFNLVFIGGDHENKMNGYIEQLFKDYTNITLFLLGYVFPIPYDWIKISDVSIASSNSILVSANEGIPTIAIDTQDFQPLGVYGYTTDNLWIRDDEPKTPISDLLKEILIEKKYPKKKFEFNVNDDLESHLKSHLEHLNASDSRKIYYDVENMFTARDKVLHFSKGIVIKLYLRVKSIWNRKT